MDIDGYQARHGGQWARLAELTARARRPRRLGAGELDELVVLYQRTATQLSYVRTASGDPALVARLTALVADANAVVSGTRGSLRRSLAEFFRTTFPLAVWSGRRFLAASALLLVVPAFAVGAWLAVSPAALEAAAPPAVRQAYVEQEFEAYYSSAPAAEFSSQVFVNNVRVSILAYALGVLGCVFTAALLVVNGANIGTAAGLFTAAGEWEKFWGLILPHGLLELSAVVVAGAAGLRLGWAVVAPGDRSRVDALAQEGRHTVPVVIGLVLAFAVAGVLEGFVTPSALPTVARVGIGATVSIAFWTSIVVFGQAAEFRTDRRPGPATGP